MALRLQTLKQIPNVVPPEKDVEAEAIAQQEKEEARKRELREARERERQENIERRKRERLAKEKRQKTRKFLYVLFFLIILFVGYHLLRKKKVSVTVASDTAVVRSLKSPSESSFFKKTTPQ